jgi:hypothetical protein
VNPREFWRIPEKPGEVTEKSDPAGPVKSTRACGGREGTSRVRQNRPRGGSQGKSARGGCGGNSPLDGGGEG